MHGMERAAAYAGWNGAQKRREGVSESVRVWGWEWGWHHLEHALELRPQPRHPRHLPSRQPDVHPEARRGGEGDERGAPPRSGRDERRQHGAQRPLKLEVAHRDGDARRAKPTQPACRAVRESSKQETKTGLVRRGQASGLHDGWTEGRERHRGAAGEALAGEGAAWRVGSS